ncbi:tripartite ATP-independent transporter DctM subunit [Mesorhizobium sp. J18]|uniref:TRAP transporter large permease n=1 Tax=Mesorhizobium sp. J18 TaxID=935263 RepID=UPI00119A1A64|nr:TRAP transporter large permease subunit [Mesorhizobium sp. J18]TWG97309.1 tripartite ATP-independent transporter DctM subunit [Mesorhizobium sp. J18]
MDRDLLALGFVVGLFLLLFLGIPIAAAILLLSVIGIMLVVKIDPALALATAFHGQMTNWGLTALPLFVLMGELLSRAKIAQKLFDAFAILVGRMPGGLIQVNVFASTLFSALSGSSTATVATIGKLSVAPLRARKYPDGLILGSLGGAGTLGILIPPSVALILYGFAFNVSIGDLFLAGILPGLLLAAMFCIYVMLRHRVVGEEQLPGDGSKIGALISLVPLVILIGIVFGAIYGGFATPTEAAVIGVVGALVLGWMDGELSAGVIVDSLKAAVMFCATIGIILGASAGLQVAMAYTGVPRTIVTWIQNAELSYYGLLLMIAIILIVLGCFMDGLSMIVLTSSVLHPIAQSAGFDLIWFGIFVVVLVEIGLITPPIGFNLFVLQRVSGRQLPFIAVACFPFLLIMLLALVIFTIFPSIVTILPDIL